MDAINQPLARRSRPLGGVPLAGRRHHADAVDQVSFSRSSRGECVALVGESGSGKSVSALSILKLLPYPNALRIPRAAIRFKTASELIDRHPSGRVREVRLGSDISIIFQEPMTSLNPLHTIEAQIGEIICALHPASRRAARARTLELLKAGRHSRARARLKQLSAPALRRPAPARDDRDGAGQRARPPDRGRADHRARCHRAGPDPGAAR